MKLLIDENLSFRLTSALKKEFANSIHVRDVDLLRADDGSIWHFAKANGFTILTQDDDFLEMSGLFGHPPKVIHLGIGNSRTQRIIDLLIGEHQVIKAFGMDPDSGLLILR